jgi:Flp pilus assembly protein CpaB
MEMEFKDSSRRRTLVLVVGVLLALAAGAGVFYLASQGTQKTETVFQTRNILVAAIPIAARTNIEATMVTTRTVPADPTNQNAYTDPEQVLNQVTAVAIPQFQPITPNLLATTSGTATVAILRPEETVSPLSPVLRAVSVSIPLDRAVGGKVAPGQHVDLIATLGESVQALPFDLGGETAPAPGEEPAPVPVFRGDISTKIAWTDVVLLDVPSEGLYIFRVDLKQAEEISHAQNAGGQFTMVLRPDQDNRDIDRSSYGETTARFVERYNFPIPEVIDSVDYPQPSPFPTPFPAEPYLSPAPSASPSPEAAVVVTPAEPTPTP